MSHTKTWLCSNCNFNVNCITEKKSLTPIIQCNDYEVDLVDDKTLSTEFPIVEVNPEFKGLCGYCEHRAYCTMKSENEIKITCEEYK